MGAATPSRDHEVFFGAALSGTKSAVLLAEELRIKNDQNEVNVSHSSV
jgi:hypothetical protein